MIAMSNNVLKSCITFAATIFGLVVVLISDEIELDAKIVAILITIVVIVVVEKRRFGDLQLRIAGTVSILLSFFRRSTLSWLIFAFVFLLTVLVFSQFSVNVGQNYVTNEEYWNYTSPSCPNNYGYPKINPVVDVTAQCALDYAAHRTNWCCKYDLPFRTEVNSNNKPAVGQNCSPIAEYVFNRSGEDKPKLSILQGNLVTPIRPDVSDECTSFRMKSRCLWFCGLLD